MLNAGKGLSQYRCCQHGKSAFDGTCSIIGPVIFRSGFCSRVTKCLHLCLCACPLTTCVDAQMLLQAGLSSQNTSDAVLGAAVIIGAMQRRTKAGHPRVSRARWRPQPPLCLPSECMVPTLGLNRLTKIHTMLLKLSRFQ